MTQAKPISPNGFLPSQFPEGWDSCRMRVTGHLTQPQRILVIIALALALAAVGEYLMTRGTAARFGWYAYAPLSQPAFSSGPGAGESSWLHLLIWLVLIAVWAAISVRILRPSPEQPPQE